MKRFILIFTIVVLVVSLLALPAAAAGWDKSNITVIDYLDYADSDHLEIDTNQSFVVIDIPADHAESVFVQNIDNKDNTFADGTSDTVMIPSGDNTVKYLSFPTLDYHYTENRTRDGYLFDVSNFPQGTTMSWEWTIEFTGYSGDITNLGDSFDYWCYFFNAPDEYGWSYRGGRTSLFGLPAYDDTKKIVAYCEYKHGSSTVGSTSPYVAPLIRFESLEFSKLPAEITVKTSSVKVMIPITDDLLDLAQSEKTQKLLNEINDQLADQGKTMEEILDQQQQTNDKIDEIIDHEPTPERPDWQDSVDDLEDAEQDAMENVQNGMDDANKTFDSALDTLSQYAASFAGLTILFNSFADMPFFTALLSISLSLGIVAAILGIGIDAARSSSRAKARSSKKGRSG